MKRKVFININLPDRTKKRLTRAIERWADLPVKWVKEGNLHVSLFFLGFVDDDSTYEVCEAVTRATETEEIFDIEFDTIKFSPSAEDPRVVVVTGQPKVICGRNSFLELEKMPSSFSIFSAKLRKSSLGKVRKNMWQDLSEKSVIDKEFPLLVTVESVDVMASNFEGDDAEFAIIESCQLT